MKNSVRILQVVPDMAYGGVEKIVLNYYEQLNHDDYKFDFVTHGLVEDYHHNLMKQGSRIYYLKTIGKVGLRGYCEQIREQINIDDYDIIHIHIGHITGVYGAAFHKCGAKKIICHAHTTKCVNTKHNLFMPVFRLLAKKYSDKCLACGKDAGRFCFGNLEFDLLHNGINSERYIHISKEDITKLKNEFGIRDETFVIGNVAHFSEQKNHRFIVDVIKEYSKISSHVKFILVGDGPLKEEMERVVCEEGLQENVVFTGVRKDIPILMKMFNVFILPSLYEGLPVVSIEAQAAGIPCLISNTIDESLDIGLGLTEFLPIDQGCEKWILKLEEMRESRKEIIDINKIQNALIKAGYDVTVSAQRLSRVYDSLIGEIDEF